MDSFSFEISNAINMMVDVEKTIKEIISNLDKK
jgi:hypothetical protein